MSARVLVVDDDADMGTELERVLRRRGYTVVVRQSADEAFKVVLEEDIDAVVTDLNMRGMNGIDLCDRVAQNRRDVPVIVVTGFGSMETAVATLRAGAFDFLTKPFNAEQLSLSLERALRLRALEEEVKRLRAVPATTSPSMIGESEPMRAIHDLIARVAETDTMVLLTAESGAGKELVARAIHERSGRRTGPLIAINCAALPENLLESELFGHAKGAFTDAKAAKRGLFLEASGGTLFLDEIGEMPIGMQAKLLRALEDRRVRPVGGIAEVPFDARIIAATNKNLEALIEEKRFREDLYFRVNVVHVEIPPLRVRGNDILLLAEAFVARFATKHGKPIVGLSSEVAERLVGYSWPGNVRELQNALERAVALARFDRITVDDLPPKIRDYKPTYIVFGSADRTEDLVTLEELERRYIARVMELVAFNKVAATKVLGIDRSTLYRKLDRYGIGSPSEK